MAEMGNLRGTLFISMSRAEISVDVALVALEMATESLTLSVEPLELAGESLALTIAPLELAIAPLELSVLSLELAVEPLDQALETIELALEMPLAGDRRPRRFDRVDIWSEGGSRFVAMWRGAVDLGETVDEIEAGASGETTFEWFIDGETTAFDAGGRAWLQPILDWLNENAGWD